MIINKNVAFSLLFIAIAVILAGVSFVLPISPFWLMIAMLVLAGVSVVTSGIFFSFYLRNRLRIKKLYNHVYKFISPLKESYGGEIHTENSVFPYYYKNLRKKNNLFVSFDKNVDDTLTMIISITHNLNFNLRLTKDIAYNMLGDKLFEGYSAKYEEDSVVRKLKQRIRGHKNISKFLNQKDRLAILEKLLNANFQIDFDYFNINLKLNPVNIKDNYYLFRGVEAIIDLIGLDGLIMENIHVIEGKDSDKAKPKKLKKVGKFDKDKEEEEILFYGPLVQLIGLVNDKRMFIGKKKVNFKVPPGSNNTYLISALDREIYSNFTGKYIPIGSMVKAFIKSNPSVRVSNPIDGGSNKGKSNEHRVNISTSKSRININDNRCGLTLKELLISLLSPFYSGSHSHNLKYKLFSPFVSVCRYAFTDHKNFRFAFRTSDGKKCHEMVFYAKGYKTRDIYAIVKRFTQAKNIGSSIKIKWNMLYPINIRKYIKHKFINSVDSQNRIIVDGLDLYSKKQHKDPSKKSGKDFSPIKKDKFKGHKFILNLESDDDKKRLKLYSQGVLIRQLNDTPWDIKIDFPDSVDLVKDMSDFNRTRRYNELITEFFDFLSTQLVNAKVEIKEILDGMAYLADELVEDTYVIKKSLKKIKSKLMPNKEYYCRMENYEILKSFFDKDTSDKIFPILKDSTISLWSNLFISAEELLSRKLSLLDNDIKKQDLKKNQYFNKLPENHQKLIAYYINKAPFKGRIYISENSERGLSPFCSLHGNLYINISSPILSKDSDDSIFKYTVITTLLKSLGYNEKEIEREVMLC